MKSIKYFTLAILALVALSSCSKHKILFDVDPVTADDAEFQLFNALAARSGETQAFTTLNCVILGTNDTLATGSYPLYGRNMVPSGNTTRFFVRKPGTYQIRGWRSYAGAKAGEAPEYEGTMTLVAGKQYIYIYNWYQDPINIDGDYPYIRPDRPNTVEGAHYDFINLWEMPTGGMTTAAWLATKDANGSGTPDHTLLAPTTVHLQYYVQLNKTSTDEYGPAGRTEWQPIGDPVGFGEATGFSFFNIPNKGRGYTGGPGGVNVITSGYVRVYTQILVAETSEQVEYNDYWTPYCGRFYVHTCYQKGQPSKSAVWVSQITAL